MNKLNDFSNWMNANVELSDSSIYKYTRAVNTVSKDMLEEKVINKSLLDMNLTEIDIAINNIFDNRVFYDKNQKGKRMYSNSLKQFRCFLMDIGDVLEDDNLINQVKESHKLNETEKQAIINARVGQGIYRKRILEKYNHKCIITGVDKDKLLIASHIKPWSVSDNIERVDEENGLLLTPTMDKLFDSGLISFTKDGLMIVSSFVGGENSKRLHIAKNMVLDLKYSERMLLYMEYHREVLFVK